MESFDIAIIGAGISGISFALALEKHAYSHIMLEANDYAGGTIETFHSQKAADFWLEMGAHTAYNSYHHLLDYLVKQQLAEQIVKRKKLPFRLLNEKNHITSLTKPLNLFRAAPGWPLFSLTKAKGRTVREYFRLLFGTKNYDKVLSYCFNAVLCHNADNFPADFLFKKRCKNKHYPRSFTLSQGLGTLFDKKVTDKLNLRYQSPCTFIEYRQNHWHVHSGKQTYRAKKLMLATPWHVTCALLDNINHPIAQLPFSPKLSRFQSTGLVFEKTKLAHIPNLAGLIGIRQNFYSAVAKDVIEHPKYRGLTVHFEGVDISPWTLINHFLNKLNIPKSALVDSKVKQNCLPIYHQQHGKFIQALDNELTKDKRLFLSGNYFTRLAIEDCIKRSKHECERFINSDSL